MLFPKNTRNFKIIYYKIKITLNSNFSKFNKIPKQSQIVYNFIPKL